MQMKMKMKMKGVQGKARQRNARILNLPSLYIDGSGLYTEYEAYCAILNPK